MELLAQKLLTKIRMLERSFGPRPVPSLSLTVRHVDRAASGSAGPAAPVPPRRERRQMPLGTFSLAREDGVVAQQLAERSFGLFQKLVPPNAPFALNILNLQVAFAERARGQRSLSFAAPKCADEAVAVDDGDAARGAADVAALVAMGFGVAAAAEAMAETGSVDAAVERLLKRPRLKAPSQMAAEVVELD